LVFLDIDFDDGAFDAGTDGVEVHIDERIIGGFELAGVEPIQEAGDREHGQNQKENEERFLASAGAGGRWRIWRFTGFRLAGWRDGVIDGFLLSGGHGRFPFSRSGSEDSAWPTARERLS